MNEVKDYKQILLKKIKRLVDGQITVPEFEKEYYNYYLNEVPGYCLSEIEDLFFGLIQEKLDWAVENPSKEDEKDGYRNYQEYTEWVARIMNIFLKNKGVGSDTNYDQYCSLW